MTFLKNKIKRKKIVYVLLVILGVFLLFVGVLAYRSKYSLSLSKFEITSEKIYTPIRLVQLSDLHNSEFGKNNERLVTLVKEQHPDLILVTGDMLNREEEVTEIATDLFLRLKEIAPVYVSMGNHEREYEENFGVDIKRLYEAAGVTVLDFESEDITVNGQTIRLGGLYGYCLPEMYLSSGEARENECDFLRDFQNTEEFTLLLTHMPVCWMINGSLDSWDIDCVLTGHVHGGQIRLPGIGGLYAPDMGWFPGEVAGRYDSADGKKVMILSRGLGNNSRLPRWNNVPEVVAVDLLPGES